ncbi:MAG TPA: HAD family hydrolase [Burkholderiales bacterium]|nr:HAD family hydrolase [Burkholderiales bacterium]
MTLALFDLDNTLLSGDTDYEWTTFLVEEGILPPGAMQENRAMDERYRTGAADVLEYVRFYLRPYAPLDMARLHALRDKFLPRIAAKVVPAARNLLAQHEKDLRVMITATNRFLTEPIARMLGLEHLIATEPQLRDGRFTGDVAGTPCMREGKISRLDEWLGSRGASFAQYESWFYSDSINDLPLLSRVTHPVAVDPDPSLERIARERGWKVISLRQA